MRHCHRVLQQLEHLTLRHLPPLVEGQVGQYKLHYDFIVGHPMGCLEDLLKLPELNLSQSLSPLLSLSSPHLLHDTNNDLHLSILLSPEDPAILQQILQDKSIVVV